MILFNLNEKTQKIKLITNIKSVHYFWYLVKKTRAFYYTNIRVKKKAFFFNLS